MFTRYPVALRPTPQRHRAAWSRPVTLPRRCDDLPETRDDRDDLPETRDDRDDLPDTCVNRGKLSETHDNPNNSPETPNNSLETNHNAAARIMSSQTGSGVRSRFARPPSAASKRRLG